MKTLCMAVDLVASIQFFWKVCKARRVTFYSVAYRALYFNSDFDGSDCMLS